MDRRIRTIASKQPLQNNFFMAIASEAPRQNSMSGKNRLIAGM
jgi:hypothetical protein